MKAAQGLHPGLFSAAPTGSGLYLRARRAVPVRFRDALALMQGRPQLRRQGWVAFPA
jgi:hypothetical protein